MRCSNEGIRGTRQGKADVPAKKAWSTLKGVWLVVAAARQQYAPGCHDAKLIRNSKRRSRTQQFRNAPLVGLGNIVSHKSERSVARVPL